MLLINWRAAFTSPAKPLKWGATSFEEFIAEEPNHEEQDASDGSKSNRTRTSGEGDTERESSGESSSGRSGHRDSGRSPFWRLEPEEARRVREASGLYELLGLPLTASNDEIRNAFRHKSKQHHPDLNPNNAHDATIEMTRLNEAREILNDERLRAAYDWQESGAR